ncbi:N-acetyltransferase family protein [Mycolicibacterium thermoresistibile]
MKIVDLTRDDLEPLADFFAALSDRDRTFIQYDVSDPRVIAALPDEPGRRWVARDATGGRIAGFASVRPLSGWSDHVGNLNLIVHPDHRRAGVGAQLARRALAESLRGGLHKLQVELAADHDSAIEMFNELGFTGEALLRDHIRDRNGEYHDCIVLAHLVDDAWPTMTTIGLADELTD